MTPMLNTLGIIGTGPVGRAIARRAVDVGITVVVSNSRGPESLRELVQDLGELARAATPAETARSADLVVATIPLRAFEELPADELAGRVVIDTMNYAPDDQWSVPELDSDQLTSTQLVQRHLAGSRVVKAFNNFGPAHLQSLARPHGAPDRTAMPIAGDDAGAKAQVAALLDAFGYDAVDIGGLAESWRSEPNAPVYAFCYLPEVPPGLDGFEGFMAWIAQAPGVTVTTPEVKELVAAAVRGPAGFRLPTPGQP